MRAPWARFPLTSALLNSFDLVLAHNDEVREAGRRLGISTPRLVVLETRPAQLGAGAQHGGAGDGDRPFVFVPTSFSADEPIDVLLQAAALLPEARFALTGRLAKARSLG